jgi:hypothetical protein
VIRVGAWVVKRGKVVFCRAIAADTKTIRLEASLPLEDLLGERSRSSSCLCHVVSCHVLGKLTLKLLRLLASMLKIQTHNIIV